MEEKKPIKPVTQTKNQSVKYLFAGLAALLVFSSGWAFGKGNVNLTTLRDGTVNNSVLNYDSVDEVHRKLQRYFDGEVNNDKALDGLKSGLASSVDDPYTEFFNVEDSKAFEEELSGSFQGIGAELGKEGGNIVVIAPIAGFPAEKAGVRSGDIIVLIDDQPASDLTITEAVKLIRGEAGTNVKLTMSREGQKVEVTITRAKIDIPSVKWEIKDGVGIMTVSRYSDDTTSLAEKAATEFIAANVKGVVVDLRNNPGGLLDESVKFSSLWLEENAIVLLEKRGGKIDQTFKADGNNVLKGKKTVVLINGGSASASEITAGALRDNGAATLIGEKTYGKGSVQQILELTGGGTLKVTIARWFTPNDKNIDKEGIPPDTEVKLTEENIKNKQDPQLEAALKAVQ